MAATNFFSLFYGYLCLILRQSCSCAVRTLRAFSLSQTQLAHKKPEKNDWLAHCARPPRCERKALRQSLKKAVDSSILIAAPFSLSQIQLAHKKPEKKGISLLSYVLGFGLFFAMHTANAAVLPQERADAMYHSYQGGGMSIDGPSILVRKNIGNQVSVSANYYVDTISGASIDVLATASPYAEERTEHTVGVDYLKDKTLMNLSYTSSSENDFEARSVHLGISQDFFGDLTTLSLGYSKGWDEVGRRGDDLFNQEADRQQFQLGLTQVLTKNLIMGLSLENISDQGFLNNPYRSVRFLDETAPRGYRFEAEKYPNTRTSNALALTANYYLPYRASVYAEARAFSDTWGIDANTYKVGYIHTFGDDWILDVRLRHYAQDQADFYQDMFSRSEQFNFRARDKELSSFSNLSVGFSLTWEYRFSRQSWVKKSTLNYELDHIRFNYDNFRNVLADAAAGEEPLYEFSANVTRLYVSIWY